MKLRTWVGVAGTTVGGYIGWYVGAPIGFMTAFFLSMLGTGLGLWGARKLAAEYLE